MNLNRTKQVLLNYAGSISVFFLIIYLIFATGIHSDDYDHIIKENILNINKLKNYISYLPTVLYNFSLFSFCGKNLIFYDLFKIINTMFCTFFIYKFISDYMSKNRALLFSFLFIFFPTHDATNYWIIGQYLMVTISLIFMSHYLINHSRYFSGFFFGLMGSFYSYASPPVNFGLSIIFLLQKKYKKFCLFIIPELLYLSYYYLITRLYTKTATIRDGNFSDIFLLFKNYIIQVLSSIDAFFGPSFFLKIYLSIKQLTSISICIGIAGIFIFYRGFEKKSEKLNKYLLISFLSIVLFAFAIFALTGGYYTQIVFNLGNRVTIYGAILISYIIVIKGMKNKFIATTLFSILFLSILGLSEHWKAWNIKQNIIIENISKNIELKEIGDEEKLFVINNHFSKLGQINHIEFLSESTINSIFFFSSGRRYQLVSLKNRFELEGDFFVDKKYGHKYKINHDYIKVYDTEKNEVLTVKKDDIEVYVKSLDKNTRHWIQLLNKDNLIIKIIVKFIPRLEYLF